MKFIGVEEHFSSNIINEEVAKYGKASYLQNLPKEVNEKFAKMRFTTPVLEEIGQDRLDFMAYHQVDMQIISYTNPVPDSVPKEKAVELCKKANDILAEKIKKYPDKFKAFATLPMASPIDAAIELERCVKEYGFVGALISGTYQNKFYDDEEFLPIFKKAEELDVPISWHPEFIDSKILEHYYLSSNYSTLIGMQFGSAGFGWHLDVGLHMTRLVLSGIFDKFPNLKFISGHYGETIPAMLDRMDQIMTQEQTGLKKPISAYFKENIYYTPSGIISNNQLEYVVKVFGASHILWALDYPYVPFKSSFASFLLNANLTDEEKELIAHKNAEKLFHLN